MVNKCVLTWPHVTTGALLLQGPSTHPATTSQAPTISKCFHALQYWPRALTSPYSLTGIITLPVSIQMPPLLRVFHKPEASRILLFLLMCSFVLPALHFLLIPCPLSPVDRGLEARSTLPHTRGGTSTFPRLWLPLKQCPRGVE